MSDATKIIELLHLQPHPEGGYYAETYRDPDRTSTDRHTSTLIYFLLKEGEVSHLHRIDAAEGWHFYDGDALEVIELSEEGPSMTSVGKDLVSGERPQYVVAKNQWFGARVKKGGSWALVGCSVAPGFSYDKFELGKRSALLSQFPNCAEVITALTVQD